MAARRRSGRRILKALLPIILVLAVGLGLALGWLAYTTTHPPRRAHLITPETFTQLSGRGLTVSDETWPNRDGTTARGWLLRGAEGAPGIILLHAYGQNRSWLLNLGVKLNETANFTVLFPDLRGHGEDPPVGASTFGARETADVLAAIDYLRALRTPLDRPLVADRVGLYGLEVGAYAALRAAAEEAGVRALALDSVPATPDDALRAATRERTGLDAEILHLFARAGVRLYLLGGYENTPACELAARSGGRRVLLLTGERAGYLREQTVALAQCFPDPALVELQSELPLTGFELASAPGEQGEAYDRRVIDFFDRTLRAAP